MAPLLHDVEVDELRLHPFETRLHRPLKTARGKLERRSSVLVEMRATVAGLEVIGWGEASPLPGWGTDSLAEARYDLGRARDAVFAGAVTDPQKLLAMLRFPTARFAVSSALLDAVAHARHKPLRTIIDPDAPHLLPLNATIGLEAPERAAQLALDAVERGFKTIKLKAGDTDDSARVAAVRRAAPEVKLRLDTNAAWRSVEAALHALEALAVHNIEYVEQPLAADALDLLVELRGKSPIRIAADESCMPAARCVELIERRAVDVIVLKPSLLGSWDEIGALVERGRSAGLPVVFTSSLDTAVGRRTAAQMAAALLGKVACGFATAWLEPDVSPAEDRIVDGQLYLGSGNGIGFVPQIGDDS